MATAFSQPPLDIVQPVPDYQNRAYMSQSSITPPNSDPTTPSNVSPASPRSVWSLPAHLQAQTKQLRTPRSPMYIPAVLRPTEKPVRQSPPKNPNAAVAESSSPESRHSAETGRLVERRPPALRRMVTDEWNNPVPRKLTGPPSRNHWKPDPSSPTCDSPSCERSFNFFLRRHHCRRCGHIFCSQHSPHVVPLDQHARFHAAAPKFRACEDCFRDYTVWESETAQRSSSLDGGDANDAFRAEASAATPVDGIAIQGKKKDSSGLMGTLAQSVPRDWNWSTF